MANDLESEEARIQDWTDAQIARLTIQHASIMRSTGELSDIPVTYPTNAAYVAAQRRLLNHT